MTEPLVRSGSAHQGRIDAVTFDFWDTICCAPKVDATRAARVERLTGVLHGVSGEPVTEERIEAAVLEVLARFNQHWGENIQFTHVEAVDALSEILGLTLDAEGRATVELAFTGEQRTTVPPLTPNVEVAVRALKDAGVRVGIICDVGLAPSRVLRRHLDHHGLLELFDHWSFSD